MRRRRPSLGKSQRRKPRRRWLRTLLGVLILTMGGAGVWFGAGWLDEDGVEPLRTLAPDERDEGVREAEKAIPRPGARVRVEVLNAGGIRGAAAQVRDHLRDAGFDVVYFGNASTFGGGASRVLLRAGPLSQAEAVAQALGLSEVDVREDPSLLVDVTVLVGENWPDEWAQIQRRGVEETP
jgi:hypothetical protein